VGAVEEIEGRELKAALREPRVEARPVHAVANGDFDGAQEELEKIRLVVRVPRPHRVHDPVRAPHLEDLDSERAKSVEEAASGAARALFLHGFVVCGKDGAVVARSGLEDRFPIEGNREIEQSAGPGERGERREGRREANDVEKSVGDDEIERTPVLARELLERRRGKLRRKGERSQSATGFVEERSPGLDSHVANGRDRLEELPRRDSLSARAESGPDVGNPEEPNARLPHLPPQSVPDAEVQRPVVHRPFREEIPGEVAHRGLRHLIAWDIQFDVMTERVASAILSDLHLRLEAARAGIRPFVTLAYAQSLDGSIAGEGNRPLSLSSAGSRKLTHELRAAHDAILVGIGTVVADNPRLNVRLATGEDPRPIVVDSTLRIPRDARLLENGRGAWLATTEAADVASEIDLESRGARVLRLPALENGWVDLEALLERLVRRGVRHVLVEGGARILTSFLESKLVDYLVVTISPRFVGGLRPLDSGELASFPSLVSWRSERVGEDLVMAGGLFCPP